MKENLVSFRIDSALMQELEHAAKEGHYLDLSELMRSIIRKKFLSAKYPVAHELEKIKEELKAELRRERDG